MPASDGAGPACRRTGDKKFLLAVITRQRRRLLELDPGFAQTAGAEQDVAAGGRQWRIVAQLRDRCDFVDQPQARLRPKCKAVGHCPMRSTTGDGMTSRSRS